MSKSVAEKLADLPEEERDAILAGLDTEDLEYDQGFWLRPEQLSAVHSETWLTLLLAGRGSGKTKTESEWVRDKAKVPNTRIALVARTVADVRDTMVTGESGILAVSAPSELPEYIPSARTLRWPNGSVALTYSSMKADQLRGPQFHYAAADELASWCMDPDPSGLSAWDNLKIATRLGPNPQIMAATTPKRVPIIRKLVEQAKEDPSKVNLFRGATLDNLANLSAAYIENIYQQYAGTSIARQELFGELLDEVDGALWHSVTMINPYRMKQPSDIMERKYLRVVGVDPSVSAHPTDECGIVVVASTQERALYQRHGFVLADRSLKAGPEEWAKEVCRTARRWNAVVVAEKNQGHELVRIAIHNEDPNIPVIPVQAMKNKAERAEPVVQAYEQGRVHHCGPEEGLALLEDEQTSWVPGESGYSPNRLDAVVWGLHSLLGDDTKLRRLVGNLRVVSSATQRGATIPGVIPAYRRGRSSGDKRFSPRH